MKKQQTPGPEADKEQQPDQKATSDTVKNAHAAGDGALEKTDVLTPAAEQEKDNLTSEELRKGAAEY